jgi:hypothetical protein
VNATRGRTERSVEANARLTGATGLVLLVLRLGYWPPSTPPTASGSTPFIQAPARPPEGYKRLGEQLPPLGQVGQVSDVVDGVLFPCLSSWAQRPTADLACADGSPGTQGCVDY